MKIQLKTVQLLMFTGILLSLGLLFVHSPAHASSVDSAIGAIDVPPGVDKQIAKAGSGTDIAIFFFLSSLLKIANVVAGVWIMFNFVLAGFNYVSGQGSPDAHKKVRDKITMSVVGIFLLVLAYAATAVISLLFFGDATYVLNPTIL